MITGIVKSGPKSGPDFIEVFWRIKELDKKLEEDHVLQSVPFYFAGQMWRQLLINVDILTSHIAFSISRITVLKKRTPDSTAVRWNTGIVDSDGRLHYCRNGFVRLETVFEEWMSVADFSGPEINHLRSQKDLYMPCDAITIALRLVLDSRDPLIKDNQDLNPKDSIVEQSSRNLNVVIINVKDKTFYAEDSILGEISEVMKLKIFESERVGGEKTVIDLPDCDPKAFEYFLSFALSKEAEGITDDIAEEVYHIAHEFQVPKLKRECVQYFLSKLSASSVCRILELAERYHDQALKKKCSEFFLKNGREVLKTSEWLKFMVTKTELANDLIISYFESTLI